MLHKFAGQKPIEAHHAKHAGKCCYRDHIGIQAKIRYPEAARHKDGNRKPDQIDTDLLGQ